MRIAIEKHEPDKSAKLTWGIFLGIFGGLGSKSHNNGHFNCIINFLPLCSNLANAAQAKPTAVHTEKTTILP